MLARTRLNTLNHCLKRCVSVDAETVAAARECRYLASTGKVKKTLGLYKAIRNGISKDGDLHRMKGLIAQDDLKGAMELYQRRMASDSVSDLHHGDHHSFPGAVTEGPAEPSRMAPYLEWVVPLPWPEHMFEELPAIKTCPEEETHH